MTLVKAQGSNPKTVIRMLRTKAPLLVQRILYPDPEMPEMGHIFLMSSSGGLLQGDRLLVNITAGDRTLSRITTQASTKIYKMDSGFATSQVRIHACGESYLEFMPHSTIPYKKSRLYQETEIRINPRATVVYSEIFSAGRIASGEKFDFDVYFKKLTARDEDDSLLFSDGMLLEPNQAKKDVSELLGGRTIMCTVYVFCPAANILEIEKMIEPFFSDNKVRYDVARQSDSILVGYSRLHADRGFIVKMLTDSIDKATSRAELVSALVRQDFRKRRELRLVS